MKKTKQQIIDELKEDLINSKASVKKSENMLYEIKRLLFGDSYNYDFEDIYPEVKSLIDYKHYHEGSINIQVSILEKENKKYWNLIRSLVGDETLEKEMERSDEENIPYFHKEHLNGRGC